MLLSLTAWLHVWDIRDWIELKRYHPSPQISLIADSTAMTEYARKIFYLNHPVVAGKDEFNNACGAIVARWKTGLLGCRLPNGGIFIFEVSDPSLQGAMEVTAAHEMLHDAYARLGFTERQDLDRQMLEALPQITNHADKDFLKRIEQYHHNGADVADELHSILGTEFSNLPVALEAHYRKYFTDRKKVVALFDGYHAKLAASAQAVEARDDEMTAMWQRMNAQKQALTSMQQTLTAEIRHIEQLKSENKTSELNQAIADFRLHQSEYNRSITEANQLIAKYNQLVKETNVISNGLREQMKAMDSRF